MYSTYVKTLYDKLLMIRLQFPELFRGLHCYRSYCMESLAHGSTFTEIDCWTLSHYWRRRLPLTLQKSVAAGILDTRKDGQLSFSCSIVDQSIVRF